jgi:hypothetical protein
MQYMERNMTKFNKRQALGVAVGYQPLQKASERYMRNHMDLNDLEEGNRFPRGE